VKKTKIKGGVASMEIREDEEEAQLIGLNVGYLTV